MKGALLLALGNRRTEGRLVALVTRLSDGVQSLVDDECVEGELAFDHTELEKVRLRLRLENSGTVNEDFFVRVYNRPLRLVLVGAVHIAQALIPIATTTGFKVTIIDPRTAFATDARFPQVDLITKWPDCAMARLAPDQRTAIVTLTHDPKLDDPALLEALKSEAFFIGSLGSRKTHAVRVKRLRERGIGADLLQRIHAPVGLPLGGRRPAEIAVSIMAEIIQVLRAGNPE